jgi:hypothetical protein
MSWGWRLKDPYGTSIADRPPAKIATWPYVSALAATSAADEARLDVTQPYIIGPLVGGHLDGVRATVVAAVDQDRKNAG